MDKLLGLIGSLSKILMSCCLQSIFIVEMKPARFFTKVGSCKGIDLCMRKAFNKLLKVALIEIILKVNMHCLRM